MGKPTHQFPVVTGKQAFMGRDIPIVLGGFGPGARCICDKTVAEIHGMETKHVRELINRNIDRFRKCVDYIDLAQRVVQNDTLEILASLGYAKQSITQAQHIYLLSERGYAKLVKIMDTDQAWYIYERLLDEYFHLREVSRREIDPSSLSPELQIVKALFDSMARTEIEQKRQARALTEVNQRVDDIREMVVFHPDTWRSDCQKLLRKAAQAKGGIDAYRDINAEAFELVDRRAGVSLDTRLRNKRRRMAKDGVCKTRCDKTNKMDVIEEDKKLIEIYTGIVKELAIRDGVTVV